jgi:hypothetical protein
MDGTGIYGYRLDGTQGKLGITGLKEVVRDLRALSVDTREAMQATHRRAGEIVALRAGTLVPVRTGTLRETIASAPTKYQGRVRAGRGQSVPYAGPIHFGWPARRIAPQPFIYDALDERRDEVVDLYTRRINELILEHDLGVGQRSTANA